MSSPTSVAGPDLTDLDRFAAGFPYETFAQLRAEAPVFFHEPTPHTPDGEGFWVVTRHADCRALAADGVALSSQTGPGRSGAGGTLIEDLPEGVAGALVNMMDDPRHQRIRRVVVPAVGPRPLTAMESVLEARIDAILDRVAGQDSCDFLVDVAAELPLQAICLLMGVPEADRHDLFRWANVTFDYDDRDLGETTDRAAEAGARLSEYGAQLVARKRVEPDDDIISAVVHAAIEGEDGELGPLSEAELQMFFNLLIAAGSETTRNSIAIGLAALLDNPAQLEMLRRDRTLIARAVEEILRFASVTPYNRRTATRDLTVRGNRIRAGDKVTLWWASANRDEDVFDDPDSFDITRDPNPHLAFGHGPHACLGANLARREIRIVINAVLDRWTDIEISGPIEWTRSNKHTGVRHMPVKFRTRG